MATLPFFLVKFIIISCYISLTVKFPGLRHSLKAIYVVLLMAFSVPVGISRYPVHSLVYLCSSAFSCYMLSSTRFEHAFNIFLVPLCGNGHSQLKWNAKSCTSPPMFASQCCPLWGDIWKNWNDTEKGASARHNFYTEFQSGFLIRAFPFLCTRLT